MITIIAALPVESARISGSAPEYSPPQNQALITPKPEFFNPSVNSTLAGNAIEFRLEWTDARGLSSYIFSYDSGSGSFVNDSSVPFSGTVNWSNVTKISSPDVGEKMRWKVYATDLGGNANASYTYCLVAGSPRRISTLSSYVTMTDDCYDVLLYDGSTIENAGNSPQLVETGSSFVGYHEVSWNPQMTLALLTGYNDTLASFDGNSIKTIQTGLPGSADLVGISWNPDGSSALIAGSLGNTGYLLEYSGGAVSVLNVSETGWNAVAWNPDGRYALLIGDSGTIAKFSPPDVLKQVISGTSANLEGIDFVPSGTRALIAGKSGVLLEYFDQNSSLIALSSLSNNAPQFVKFDRSGSYALITAQNNGADDLFGWTGPGKATALNTPISNTANEVTFAPNDTYALVTTTTGSLLKVNYPSNSSSLLNITTTRLRGIDWFVAGGATTSTTSSSTQSTTTSSLQTSLRSSTAGSTITTSSSLLSTNSSTANSSSPGICCTTSSSSSGEASSDTQSAQQTVLLTSESSHNLQSGISLLQLSSLGVVATAACFALFYFKSRLRDSAGN